ncbi:MAG TPA: hypothetical protein VG860_07830 [Terriglobia bacterium]|jgi:hypothetical protein|nr:hypothetical protein [Terriglobia bacterium]
MSEDTAKLAVDPGLAASAEPQSGALAAAQPGFPAEAFACPHCGQMLGPGVRVCAVCRQAIDPGQIRLPEVKSPAPVLHAKAPEKPRNTPFPWAIFLAVLVGLVVLSGLAEKRFGLTATAYGFGLVQLVTALWVVFDANSKRIPQPLQWGVGTMLLWVIVFPWYLARRRQLNTACPFVESGARSLLRIVLLFLLINLAGMLFLGSVLNQLPK